MRNYEFALDLKLWNPDSSTSEVKFCFSELDYFFLVVLVVFCIFQTYGLIDRIF